MPPAIVNADHALHQKYRAGAPSQMLRARITNRLIRPDPMLPSDVMMRTSGMAERVTERDDVGRHSGRLARTQTEVWRYANDVNGPALCGDSQVGARCFRLRNCVLKRIWRTQDGACVLEPASDDERDGAEAVQYGTKRLWG
jgi:hypothetical protein